MGSRRSFAIAMATLLLAVSVPSATAAQPEGSSSPGVRGPFIGEKVKPKLSKAVRDLPAVPPGASKGNPLLSTSSVDTATVTGVVDPVAQFSAGTSP